MDASLQPRGNGFEIRFMQAPDPDFRRAIRTVFRTAGSAHLDPHAEQLALHAEAASHENPSANWVLAAFLHDRLVAACFVQSSPGAAALLTIPSGPWLGQSLDALPILLRAAQSRAWERSNVLLELLVEPAHPRLVDAFRAGGFRYLTRLLYFRRPVGQPDRFRTPDPAFEWVSYSKQTEPLFRDALAQTYVQSMDCPELTDLRTAEEVLAGHRSVGAFDPRLWWVAKTAGNSVGLILLNKLPRSRTLELVYMGVACSAPGTGVGDALLQRAVKSAADANVASLALAADHRNTPARRLYDRWGFVRITERDAWIASSSRP
jgi:ribosomal protein S18 acetylase RimI-like enzyme